MIHQLKIMLKRNICRVACTFLFHLFVNAAFGQVKEPAQAKKIEVDLINQEIMENLPYDVKFELTGTPLQDADRLTLTTIIKDNNVSNNLLSANINWLKPNPRKGVDESKSIKFSLLFTNGKYLRPNHKYTFTVLAEKKKLDGTFTTINTISLTGFTQSSLSDHVKLDFGIGYAPKPQAVIGLTTAHVYLSPINEDTDLKDSDLSIASHVSQRVSFFAGVSPVTLSDKTEQGITKKYGLGNLVYGIGLRSLFYAPWCDTGTAGRIFLQPLRIEFGILNFKQKNQNMAISNDVNKQAPYVSITYDLNIAAVLGPIGILLTK